MKIQNTSLLLLSLLLSLSALQAVPTDPTGSNNSNPPSLPSNPALPTPPTAPSQTENKILTLADSGSTRTISLSDTNHSYIEISLPVTSDMSWCYVENVPIEKGLLALSYTPITYSYATDPDDDTKVKSVSISDWMFLPLPEAEGSSVTLSFYARDYDGRLFPTPYNQVYTFTINVVK